MATAAVCSGAKFLISLIQVQGIDRLRVADASVMPTVTSGNTNAPTVMIGERAADFIKKRWLGATNVSSFTSS